MKCHQLLVLLPLVCLLSVLAAASDNPGLGIKVTKAGTNYVLTVAMDLLTEKVTQLKIPDQHGDAKVPVVGHISYDVTQLKITSFTKPSSSIDMVPGKGVTWVVSGAGASLHGNWHYKNHGFIHISDSGTFDVTASGIDIQVSVAIGVDSNGRPTLTLLSSSVSMRDLSVKFHGGASWLYNLFKNKIAGALKTPFVNGIKNAVDDVINKSAKEQLQTLKLDVVIAKVLDLDYRLIAPPTFGKDYLETKHKGEVFWAGDMTEAPVKCPVMPDMTDSNMMVQFAVTDYVMNTIGYVLQKHNLIRYTLTAKDLPPKSRAYLNTTCPGGECVGKLVPQLAKKYPNCSVELRMKTIEAPTLGITNNAINGLFNGNISFYTTLPDGSKPYLFTLFATVKFALVVDFKKVHLVAKIENYDQTVKVLESNIGKLNEGFLNVMLKFAINTFVIPKLNELGEKGIALPNFENVEFVGMKLVKVKNALMVATDIKYIPDQSETLYFKAGYNR